jgi:predicted nucleic acid-binding protein
LGERQAMTFVLDACAIIAYLRDEDGADVVESALLGDNACVAHAVNICEVYYDCLRRGSAGQADAFLEDLASIGLITREDMDAALWKTVGGYKAAIARVSLADCFAMPLTQRLNAELVTSDHREFDPIAALGICPIRFIR